MALRITAGIILAIAGLSTCFAHDKGQKKPDSDLIQGEWKITYFEQQGEVHAPEKFKSIRWNLSDGKLTISLDGKVLREGTYDVDSTKVPPHINLKGSNDGKGIYKLDGDSLTICAGAFKDKGKRPTEFKAPKSSGLMLIKFERIKK